MKKYKYYVTYNLTSPQIEAIQAKVLPNSFQDKRTSTGDNYLSFSPEQPVSKYNPIKLGEDNPQSPPNNLCSFEEHSFAEIMEFLEQDGRVIQKDISEGASTDEIIEHYL